MSVTALAWVFKQSDAKLGSRLVLLALADFAHDNGEGAFPSVDTIAQHARLTKRAARAALRKLEDDRHIESAGTSMYGTTIYRITGVDGGRMKLPGRKLATEKVSSASPDPSTNPLDPSTEKEAVGSAREEELEAWLVKHGEVTGFVPPRLGTAAHKHVSALFCARRAEGYSLEDLDLASIGAQADDFRREKGYVGPESVLRPTKIAGLVQKGRREEARADATDAKRKMYDRVVN